MVATLTTTTDCDCLKLSMAKIVEIQYPITVDQKGSPIKDLWVVTWFKQNFISS